MHTTILRPAAERVATDMRVIGCSAAFSLQTFRTPLHLSRGAISEIILAHVRVEVEGVDGRRATGQGMIYLSDLWAWPSQLVEHDAKQAAMQVLVERLCAVVPSLLDAFGHPVELGVVLHEAMGAVSHAVSAELALPEPIPLLAAGVCASPIDAALHDAHGRLHGRSSYDLLGPDCLPGDLARFLPVDAGVTLQRALALGSRPRVPGCVLISGVDPLRPADVAKPIGDGGPECAEDWMRRHGFYIAKCKPKGRDPREDAAWVAEVVRLLDAVHADLGTGAAPWVSVDPNEAYPDGAVTLDFLRALRELSPRAFAALRYIEQPIPRATGLRADLSAAAQLKPILADESITGADLLDDLVAAGWSGLALKTCKGHSLCLLLAAWSHLTGRPYALQDLSNPSLSAVHALGLAARLRTLNGIELNTMQYTPAANAAVLPSHPGVFTVRGGEHDAATVSGPGLGYGAAAAE
jgi:L-alanine-DL-glutamate epimerase-like enolase superfamily enzyme